MLNIPKLKEMVTGVFTRLIIVHSSSLLLLLLLQPLCTQKQPHIPALLSVKSPYSCDVQ